MNFEYCDGYTYTIKKGDTLYEISRSHKVPLSLLLRSNPFVDVFNLQVGDTLCIPTMQAPSRPCEMWGNCEDNSEMENPENPEMSAPSQRPAPSPTPASPQMAVPSQMSEMSQRPATMQMPEASQRPAAMQMPEASQRLAPSQNSGENMAWKRYVVKPGDTMGSLMDGRMTSLEAFGEKNGWDSVYLLPGVAYFLPEEK